MGCCFVVFLPSTCSMYIPCSMCMIHSGRILLQHDIEIQLLPLEPITDPPTFTLTCVTTGGPPTNVVWRRDNTEIDYQHNSNFTFSRTVTNLVTSTYNNTLTVTGRHPGRYNMTAWNRNTVQYIDSQSATSDLLVKGKHAMVYISTSASVYVVKAKIMELYWKSIHLQLLPRPPTSLLCKDLILPLSMSPGRHQSQETV